ncbi:FtsX-like permease family protein [Planococcus sp. X10-3]|uniref:FtsX-like permease family protein n=1 Tax=Planococcus sp. X10-3 TaxID=3061240 RepID=UPI003BAECB23
MLQKNVLRALRKKWMQLAAIGIIIILSSLTYTMMFYGISGIEEPTERYLNDYNQEDFSVEMLNTVTQQEAADPEIARFLSEGIFSLSDLKLADPGLFQTLMDRRIEAFRLQNPDASLELREFKMANYTVNGDSHSALMAKDAETINQSFIEQGQKPTGASQIAVNKIYADKNNIGIGDNLSINETDYTVTGFVLFPDYTLPMFDDSFSIDSGLQALMLLPDAAYEKLNYPESFRLAGSIPDAELLDTEIDGTELSFAGQIVTTENMTRSGAIYGELNEGKTMSLGLSIFIAAIAVIIVSIMIFNLLHAERSQIGILKALGYGRLEIAAPYFIAISAFAFLMLTIGYVLGLAAAEPLKNLYLDFYLLPSAAIGQSWIVFATAILVPLLFFSTVSGYIIYRILGDRALTLLSPPVHQSVNRISRAVSRLLSGASGATKFKYLQAIRSTGSFLIFFIGIMFSTLLIFFALMLDGTIDRLTVGYLPEVDYEYEAFLDAAQPPPPIQDGEEKFLAFPFAEHTGENISLYGLSPNNLLYKLYDDSGEDMTASLSDGVVISERLRIKQNIEIGDSLLVEINNEETEFIVRGVVEEFTADKIYVDRETLSLLLTDNRTPDLYNGIYSLAEPSSEDYQTVISKDGIINQSQSMASYSNLIFNVMIAGAAIIAASILFVLTSFTVEKNYYAISLLKVLGYSRREVNSMILSSYFVYALLCFLISIPFALFVLRRLIIVFAQDYGIVLPLIFEPVYALITLGILLFIYFASTYLSRRKIEQIPLQEVLKTYGE